MKSTDLLAPLRRPLLAVLLAFMPLLLSPARAQSRQWQRLSMTSGASAPTRIAIDDQGRAAVAGVFDEVGIFDGITLTDSDPDSSAYNDIFIAQLSPAGIWNWAVSAGGLEEEDVYDIKTDAFGNVIICGFFTFAATFGDTTLFATGRGTTPFVAKLSATGQWLWATQASTPTEGHAARILIDPLTDDVFVTGSFRDTLDCGTTRLFDLGRGDVFVGRLSGQTGAWRWAVRGGGIQGEAGAGIALGAAGELVVSGLFESFSTTFGQHTLPNSGIL